MEAVGDLNIVLQIWCNEATQVAKFDFLEGDIGIFPNRFSSDSEISIGIDFSLLLKSALYVYFLTTFILLSAINGWF